MSGSGLRSIGGLGGNAIARRHGAPACAKHLDHSADRGRTPMAAEFIADSSTTCSEPIGSSARAR